MGIAYRLLQPLGKAGIGPYLCGVSFSAKGEFPEPACISGVKDVLIRGWGETFCQTARQVYVETLKIEVLFCR